MKQQEPKHSFSVRVPEALLEVINEKAKAEKRSRNQIILLMLEQAVAHQERRTC